MSKKRKIATRVLFAVAAFSLFAHASESGNGWIELLSGALPAAWRKPLGEWCLVGKVRLRKGDDRKFEWEKGTGIAVNGERGRTVHLVSLLEHGDCEAHIEFMVPRGSNSGVYFMGRYEIQILDSWDAEKGKPKEKVKHGDCGGIYQRWRKGRGFEGHPPRVNACRAPGKWQSFDVLFRAPRFDSSGGKTADAEFVRVVHNGIIVHEHVKLSGPTRASLFNDEKPRGPLMLQGDHGPVAYRNVRIRPLGTRKFLLMQAVPMPYDQVSFQRNGKEIARYHFGRGLRRPFLFPVIGPSGRYLTRIGHPHDPVTHSHHMSVWISHHSVNGIDFWGDRGPRTGRIVHRTLGRLEDGLRRAAIVTENDWVGPEGGVVMRDRRRITTENLPDGKWILLIDIELAAPQKTVTLGATPFGPLGVRMAKTIGVRDGGGVIRNSEGRWNERAIFHRPARWVDYSGPVAPDGALEGITLMDHPSNPRHPVPFHVREDGWMGPSLTLESPLRIEPGKPLRLRYGLYIHRGDPPLEALEGRWRRFAERDSGPF